MTGLRAGTAGAGAGAGAGDPRSLPGPTAASVVSLEHLRVSLGGRVVLDDVGFEVRPGEVVGLIGANGAGKTTILKAILGLVTPEAGHVRATRSRGYVPQKVAIDPDTPLRARDLVSLGLDGERFGLRLPSRSRREVVDRMLEAVGAGAFADARVGTLSGGEQQRVLIAHALVGEPSLLLMDEPLANLDIRSGHEVVELVARLAAERGLAVLMSAHDMNALLAHMDRVVYLAEGRAASGTTEEVVRSDVLSALYRYPVRVLEVDGTVLVVAGGRLAGTDGAHH